MTQKTTQITIADIEAGLGRRPIRATSDNRGLIRRWLTANGASYSEISRLTLSELAESYNNPQTPQTPQTMTTQPVPTAHPPTTDTDATALETLRALLAPRSAPAPVVDEDAIRRIVREEAGIAPTRVVIAAAHREDVAVGTCHNQFPTLVKMLSAGVHVWLAGPAGTGKTTAAHQAATALGLPWYFNGALDSEHKLLGFTDAQGRIVSRPFREAYLTGGVYLFDEVDASLPGALLAFNAALANGRCDFPDGCHERHSDFKCIAAGNTYGHGATHDYVGRAKQDAAFLDRFVSLEWSVDEALERSIALSAIADQALGGKWIDHVQSVRGRVRAAGIRVVISPRASIHGCKLLQAGLLWGEVVEACLRRGMAAESWSAIAG